MINVYIGEDAWKQAYQKRENRTITWVVLETVKSEKIYIKEYKCWDKDFLAWCAEKKVVFSKVGLQYKTHSFSIDCNEYDSIYVIQSIFGRMGSTPRHCFSIGIVKNNLIDKKIISTPELVEVDAYIDTIEECFEQGFLRNYGKKTKTV